MSTSSTNNTKQTIVANHMIHGADYNPEQWLETPEIIDEDIRLMKLAGVNEVTIGMFSWKALEPAENEYNFEWMDMVFDKLEAAGVDVFLGTPSGARPAWMDKAHPECMRVEANRVKNLHGVRHNHCFTAPYYREKVRKMNEMLALRYKDRTNLKLWHISNEYGGECHCDYCQEAFREFLRKRYNNDIKLLNNQWWSRFWSHEYSSFDEIESPAPQGEDSIHGLNIDWRRFVSHQTIDFMLNEMEPLRRITPNVPITTNLMRLFYDIDYYEMAKHLDIASWDSYPSWHNDYEDNAKTAAAIAFSHDMNRSFKDAPFLLMESTPSQVNWQAYNKLKRPGMHALSSIHAVAHGADSVQYFQWRKGRGAYEKFHGAVVDHCGHENTRVFKEIAKLGKELANMQEIVGTNAKAEVSVLYDWENHWAINDMQCINRNKKYNETCIEHYTQFIKRGITCDVKNEEMDFEKYKLVVLPMMYMSRKSVAERIKKYVAGGGNVVLTYLSAYVNENDLCYLGGFPGDGLMEVAGVWAEEIDPLYPNDRNGVKFCENWQEEINGNLRNGDKLGAASDRKYEAKEICEIIHALEGTKVLATYTDDFYANMPAITVKEYGKGKCYYIATRVEEDCLTQLYDEIIESANINSANLKAPEGIDVAIRYSENHKYIFIMNFTKESKEVDLCNISGINIINGEEISGKLVLESYGYVVLKTKR